MIETVPLPLVPDLRRRLWGGDRLPDRLGLTPPPGDEPVAEAWLAYGGSVVASGPDRGATLAALAKDRGADLVGHAAVRRYGRTMPLLVKFLDARMELSVQVHPNDAYAAERHAGSGHQGKTESWLVVEADDGAKVQWGFRRPVREDEVREAIAQGTLGSLLREIEVNEDDLIHNPAGTVHAMGGGLMIYEIQQASDLTYRLWDHGRRGADGRPRELHVDDALAVADLSGRGDPHAARGEARDGWTQRVACPFYRLDETTVRGERGGRTDPEAMEVLTALDGRVDVVAGSARTPLGTGSTVVLPASLGSYRLEGEGRLLRARPAARVEGSGEE